MNRLNTLFLGAIVGAAAVLSSCGMECVNGNGVESTEKRELDTFSKIELGGSYKLILRQDSVQSLTIDADENLIPLVKTEVNGGQLSIDSDKDICDEVVVTISMRDLTNLDASGAVEIEMTNRFTTKEFGLDISGAVEADLNVEAQKIRTELSGAGEIAYQGKADEHEIEISGAGEIRAADMPVNKYDIDLSGAAECAIHVIRELNVTASGASSVVYRGNPAEVNQQISGAGSVKPME